MKTCTKCGKTKALADFPVRKDRPSGVLSHCKACVRAYQRKYQRVRKKAIRKAERGGTMNLLWGDNKVPALAAAAHVCTVVQKARKAFVALVDEDGDLVVVPEYRCTSQFMAMHAHAAVGTYTPASKVLDVMDDIKQHLVDLRAHMRELRRAA